jgi:hypothetical protein
MKRLQNLRFVQAPRPVMLPVTACGYRLKTDILFHFGGLNMDPLPVQ